MRHFLTLRRPTLPNARAVLVAVLGLGALAAAPMALAQFPPGYPLIAQPTWSDMIGQRIGVLLVGAIFGFIIGAFFSPALRQFRKYVGLGIAGLLVLGALFGPVPLGDLLGYFVSFILFFVALAIGLMLGRKAAVRTPAPRPTSYGSAKWATYDYLREHGIVGSAGFWLGEFRSGGQNHPLHYTGLRHLLTVAPTRSGKGVSSIIPNLLTYQGSAVIIDPKGENALVTSFRRGKGVKRLGIEGMGQNVVLVDPWDIAASKLGMLPARFNPLDWIKLGDPDAVENAFLLADALVPTAESFGEARFWDEEAKALLTGMILYVATAPEEADHRHLSRVRDLIVQPEEKLKATLAAMFKHPHPVVSTTAARTASKEERLRSNVLASTQSHTHFLDSPRIRESLSQSDFSFEDLKAKPTSVYLILPADRLHTFDRWLRLLIQQAITVNARNIEQKPERPILFLLDEMASVGRLPSLEQAYSLMAGFGMQLWGIVQDLSQLARIYGETGWQTFISNSGVIQYFGSRDKMTAEYFSTLCGVTTIEVRDFSWAVGKAIAFASSFTSGGSGSSSTSGETTTYSTTDTTSSKEAQRQLAYPDELMVLKANEQIVFVENLDPIAGEKQVWHTHAMLSQYGVNLHKPAPVQELPRAAA